MPHVTVNRVYAEWKNGADMVLFRSLKTFDLITKVETKETAVKITMLVEGKEMTVSYAHGRTVWVGIQSHKDKGPKRHQAVMRSGKTARQNRAEVERRRQDNRAKRLQKQPVKGKNSAPPKHGVGKKN